MMDHPNIASWMRRTEQAAYFVMELVRVFASRIIATRTTHTKERLDLLSRFQAISSPPEGHFIGHQALEHPGTLHDVIPCPRS